MQDSPLDDASNQSPMLSQDGDSEKLSPSNPEERISSEPYTAETKSEKEIDLNALFPEEDKDLNGLFPEEEMRTLLKKINKNRKDIAIMHERFQDELEIGEKENEEF